MRVSPKVQALQSSRAAKFKVWLSGTDLCRRHRARVARRSVTRRSRRAVKRRRCRRAAPRANRRRNQAKGRGCAWHPPFFPWLPTAGAIQSPAMALSQGLSPRERIWFKSEGLGRCRGEVGARHQRVYARLPTRHASPLPTGLIQTSNHAVEAVKACRRAGEEVGAFRAACAFAQKLAGVPEHRIGVGALVYREI